MVEPLKNFITNESNKPPECPICLTTLAKPIKLACGHRLCLICAEDLKDSLTESSKLKCPMCRREIDSDNLLENIDVEFDNFVKEKFPKAYEERMTVMEKDINELKKVEKISFEYGNLYKSIRSIAIGGNDCEWTFYFEVPNRNINDYVKKIVLKLHPTFQPSRIVLNKAPFTMTGVGWGEFEIGVKIEWQPSLNILPTNISHHLSFSRPDTRCKYVLRLKK